VTKENMSAQEFWLEQLGNTPAINEWYFSKFSGHIGNRVLEIGCGAGTFTKLMGETGAEVLGIDISSDFVEIAKQVTFDLKQVNIELADVTKQNWKEAFDTVVALDVIEHIEDDLAILKSLYGALNPGGTAIIKVPAMPKIYGTLDEVVGHYRRYSKRTIYNVMEEAGFNDISVKFFNVPGIIGWWLNGTFLRRSVPPSGQVTMFERLLPIIKTVDLISPNLFGLSLVAVANRPVS
jgi:SAM-dependent methyltransferase